MTPDYIWRKLGSESILRTPYYSVSRDRLRHPHGHELDYYVIEHARQAAGVVATDAAGRVLLVQQWRHPVQKLQWGVPAGGVEPGESPRDAAVRELREETGHAARTLEPMYHYHPTIGTSNQTFHLFHAPGVEPLPPGGAPDAGPEGGGGEIHRVAWADRARVNELIDRNEMQDGLSLAALLLWLRRA